MRSILRKDLFASAIQTTVANAEAHRDLWGQL